MLTEEKVLQAEKILGISRYCPIEEIQKKHTTLIKEVHPDRLKYLEKTPEFSAAQVNEAYETLKTWKKEGTLNIIEISPAKPKGFNDSNTFSNMIFEQLKKNLKLKEENIRKANENIKEVVTDKQEVIKTKLVKLASSLLNDFFFKSDKKDFSETVISRLKKEFKDIVDDSFKEGIIKYFNNLFGVNLKLEDFVEEDKRKAKKKVISEEKSKIKIYTGTSSKTDLNRLMNKGTARIECSILNQNGIEVNRVINLTYIETIPKKDHFIVVCSEGNKIYKLISTGV